MLVCSQPSIEAEKGRAALGTFSFEPSCMAKKTAPPPPAEDE